MVNKTHPNPIFPFQSSEVCVVEASAGSGKTFTLAKRYVQILLASEQQGSALRSILAITFTNKAAFEMKARILEFLKKIALKKLPPGEYEQIVAPLGLTEDESAERAFRVMEGLIRNYNYFQVQTIDSFINALLSGCSFKIDLSSNFDIRRNSRQYIASALDRLIDRALDEKSVRQTFERFLHQYLFIENRSGWFPKKDLQNILSTLFTQSNAFALGYLPGPVGVEDIFLKKKLVLKLMNELSAVMPQETHANFSKKFPEFLKAHPESFDVDDVSDYFAREELPVTKGHQTQRSVADLWSRIRRELKHVCEMEASALFNAYIEVFQMSLEELKFLAVREDVLFLEELNKKARSLFDEGHVTVEELYYRLATRFRHYMVDEFQDTSRLQWENLALMVEEALSTGGSFFYVGDKKQAIYSFRGGESLLFDEVKDHFSHFNVREDVLANNWRSRKNIVEFNNAVFGTENLERFIAAKEGREQEKNKKNAVGFSTEDMAQLEHIFANVRQDPKPGFDGGLVRLERLEADKKEERDELTRQKVLGLLNDIRQRFSLKDIAILTRNNSDVEAITGWLMESGIEVHSERTSNIKNNKTILEIEALLRFLDSPIDNVNFAQFILGDVFAKASGMPSASFHDFIFELRPRLSKDASFYLYREFRERFGELWERFFEGFFKNVGLYPLYEFTVSLVERFCVIENFPGDRGFIMHFLGVIKTREKDYGDLATFLEYFEDPLPEDLFVVVRGHDAVRILTIHKAKGLEFPVVILPSLEMDIKVASGGKDGQQSFVLERDGDGIRLIRLKEKYRQFSVELNALYEREYKKSFLSELNSVYVALTRAVHELYVFVPSKAGSGANAAWFLIPEDLRSLGAPMDPECSTGKTKDIERQDISPSLSHDWMVFLRDEFSDGAPVVHDARERGEIMHWALSFIGDLDKADLDDCLKAARQSVALRFPFFKDWCKLEVETRGLISRDELKNFFYAGGDQVHCEYEIVDRFGNTKRLDRLIIRADSADVLDFKSSREGQNEHLAQVRDYMLLLSALHPSKKVRGWVVYMDDGQVQEVNV